MTDTTHEQQQLHTDALLRLNKVLKTSFFSLDAVSLDVLEQYMQTTFSADKRVKTIAKWNSKVAPDEKIVQDFSLSNYTDLFPANQSKYAKMSMPKLGANLSPRTVAGHSHAGHSAFSGGRKFTNTDLSYIISDDILERFMAPSGKPYYGGVASKWAPYSTFSKLGGTSKSPREHYLEETQEFINSVVHILEDAINSRSKTISLNNYRQFELINSFIPNYIKTLDTQAFLKGCVFGGNFDNYTDIRIPGENKFGLEIGGGDEYLLNVEKAKEFGVGFGELAKLNFDDVVLKTISSEQRINLFKRLHILHEHDLVNFDGVQSWNDVLDQGKDMRKENSLVPVYVRTKKGSGVSDDGACILVAFHKFNPRKNNGLWYDSLQRGAHLMDAVDTLEKASTYFFSEGQDQVISNYISHKWLERVKNDSNYRRLHHINLNKLEQRIEQDGTTNFALFPKDDLVDITAASVNPVADFDGKHIHSSARYFLQTISILDNELTSNILAQEKLYTQNLLERFNADVKVKGSYLVPGTFSPQDFKIGFSQIPAFDAFNHFDRIAGLLASKDSAIVRENLIKHYRNQ